jgi:hypothetical protein
MCSTLRSPRVQIAKIPSGPEGTFYPHAGESLRKMRVAAMEGAQLLAGIHKDSPDQIQHRYRCPFANTHGSAGLSCLGRDSRSMALCLFLPFLLFFSSRFSFSFLWVFFLAGVRGLRRSTATGPRQAMVEEVAEKQAPEGEGEAFVRVRGREELPLSVDRNRNRE